MIPLNKATGEPHQCSENPYSQSQQQQSQQQSQQQQQEPQFKDYGVPEESVQRGITAFTMVTNLTILVEQTQKLLVSMDEKLDRLLNLAERK
jgi:hypothetical protein